MLIIPIKEGENIDRALNQSVNSTVPVGCVNCDLESNSPKPSVRNRDKMIKAQYIQKLRDKENQ